MSQHKTLDWHKLQEYRRRLSGEPDEETLERLVEMWRERLDDEAFDEEALDNELVKLLEKIHHAF